MSEIFKKTIDRLPELLSKNALTMMQRMVLVMQHAIAADRALGTSSYCALLLKLSGDDLAREFDISVKASMLAIKQAGVKSTDFSLGLSLSIEPLESVATVVSEADFLSADAAFERLLIKANGLKIKGLSTYKKDVFLASVKEAFTKAKVDPAEIERMMPFARRALNGELLNLYEKLAAL